MGAEASAYLLNDGSLNVVFELPFFCLNGHFDAYGIGDQEGASDVDAAVVAALRNFYVVKAHFCQKNGNELLKFSGAHCHEPFPERLSYPGVVLFYLKAEPVFIPLTQRHVAAPELNKARLLAPSLLPFDFRDDLGVHGRSLPAFCRLLPAIRFPVLFW